ncbi:MAG TPA: hypothetical protein VN791_00090 [Acidimicrobiales bacterium]|nr:hypothetical protein [Acidimicrobiales bacterium]
MFTMTHAGKLAAKAVAATVVGGGLALGTGGAAFAATPTTGSGSTPAATGHLRCARAPKALARIDKVEAAVTKRLPKLQAAETKLTAAGHTKLAGRVEKRINRMEKVDTKVAALATKIEARCPGVSAG